MLKTRIITAVCLMAVLIPAMFLLPNIWWAVLVGVLALFALAEWADMIGLKATTKLGYLLLGAAIGAYFFRDNYFSLNGGVSSARTIGFWAAVFWCIVAPIWLYTKMRAPRALLAGLGLLLVLSLWLGLVWGKIDARNLFVLLSTVWVADSVAYFFGKNFGKHKLAPYISPGKTWEGVAGALIGVSLYSIFLQQFDFPVATLEFTTMPVFWAVAILGIIGDLFESLIKRQFNLKDSGNCIPGHGGIWDRIDGIVSSLPVVLYLLDAIVLYR